jgi:precorrin-6Y C5,15-methyltransferase (decarboxylating)
VLKAAFARLAPGGRIAVNVATVDGLATAYPTLKGLAGSVNLWNIAVARGIEQMDRVRFEAVNPTFLLAATKGSEPGD